MVITRRCVIFEVRQIYNLKFNVNIHHNIKSIIQITKQLVNKICSIPKIFSLLKLGFTFDHTSVNYISVLYITSGLKNSRILNI